MPRLLAMCLAPSLTLALTPPAACAQRAASGARAADFAWLAGTWEGRLENTPALADVTFTMPKAGLVSGVMRLVDKDQVIVVELITITDTPGGVELHFRHFSPALDAYEPEFRQVMQLRVHAPDRDTFENGVPFDKALMSTQPRVTSFIRRSADEYVGHSDILDDQGRPGVVEVTYRRVR